MPQRLRHPPRAPPLTLPPRRRRRRCGGYRVRGGKELREKETAHDVVHGGDLADQEGQEARVVALAVHHADHVRVREEARVHRLTHRLNDISTRRSLMI